MDKRQVFIGDNSSEDVQWLCSLSDSELDMLISLKKMALQRAKVVGHESLAKRINLKMLRALAFIVVQYVKGQAKELGVTKLHGATDLLEGCNLLKLCADSERHVGQEQISACLEMDKQKRPKPRKSSQVSKPKRQKKDQHPKDSRTNN